MVPTAFDEENGVLDSPPGMFPDECEPLSVWRGPYVDYPVVISCWKITDEEFANICMTRRVWLMVYGYSMPPVILSGIKPFEWMP